GRGLGEVMPASFNVDDPAHWRGRAQEERTLVNEMRDETSRQMVFRLQRATSALQSTSKQQSATSLRLFVHGTSLSRLFPAMKVSGSTEANRKTGRSNPRLKDTSTPGTAIWLGPR